MPHVILSVLAVSLLTIVAKPVPLIIDTDIGGGGCMDVDDVGALCITNALADKGELELLAVVQDTTPHQLAGAISVINHYYGRDHVPIGAYKGADLGANAPFLPYVTDLVNNWPSQIKNTSQVESALQVYRRILAVQPDHSVVIASIGLLTNLAALFRSAPDQHSLLSGRELFARKVKLIAVMGGEYPSSGNRSQGCNFCGCVFGDDNASALTAAAAAAYVVSSMPSNVKVIYSGGSLGGSVRTGGMLPKCAPSTNPCRQAYMDYLAKPPNSPPSKTRPSWDLLTTLAAVRGAAAVGCAECTDCNGVNVVDASSGANRWMRGAPSNQTYLVLKDARVAQTTIDELLCQRPQLEPKLLEYI